MPLTREQRLEYLQKAREAKTLKRAGQKPCETPAQAKVQDSSPIEIIEEIQKTVTENKSKQKTKAVSKGESKKTLDLDLTKEIQMDAKREEQERLINEVIKVKAPAKKRIIKRVIEVEEPSTDEEVQEEVVIKPRTRTVKKQVTQTEEAHTQIPNALALQHSVEDHASGNNTKNNNLYRDIFPD